MSDLIKRLCRPGYDLQKEQAIQEAIIEIRQLRARIEAMEQQEPYAFAVRLANDGYVAQPFAAYDAVARTYGYEVRADGAIGSEGKFPGPAIKEKGGRLRVESSKGDLLGSYPATPESLGRFLESFWGAEKQAAQPASAPSIPEGVKKVTLGFHWNGAAQHYTPTIEVEFEPVPAGSPNNAKGWQDRDQLAAMLAAAPEAKP